eukprot:1524214-Amphidinium_carterae.2
MMRMMSPSLSTWRVCHDSCDHRIICERWHDFRFVLLNEYMRRLILKEFRDGLKHHGVLELLESLEVDPDHAEELFELLDVDGNGEVFLAVCGTRRIRALSP